ncbi:MAG: Ig-like domain-containing protein [Oscillospiraceae bacterium]|jgi:hypothetical protein|nr:Ig-like domain-containing protein [Oscillospiraceae bacterium]
MRKLLSKALVLLSVVIIYLGGFPALPVYSQPQEFPDEEQSYLEYDESLEQFDSSDWKSQPVNDLPLEIAVPEKTNGNSDGKKINIKGGKLSQSLPTVSNSIAGGYPLSDAPAISAPQQSVSQAYIGDTVSIKTYYDGAINAALSIAGEYCNVYTDVRATGSGLLPEGGTPSQKAIAIADEFDRSVYPLIREYFGEPLYQSGASGKINLVLLDINSDGNTLGAYTAGYFYAGDYYPGYGNDDAMLYVDIGTHQGLARLNSEKSSASYVSFFATITHEFQHLVNFSYWKDYYDRSLLYYERSDKDPDWVKNYATSVSTWYNEGLSGLAETLYLREKGFAMDANQLNYYFSNTFPNYLGHIPTSPQWQAAGNSHQIIANYGSSSIIMQEFYAAAGAEAVKALVTGRYVGYNYSKENISNGFYGTSGKFNDFFIKVSLDMQVDSPDGGDSADVYRNGVVENSWDYRSQNGIYTASVAPDSPAQFNTVSRTYYNQVYLAPSIGADNSSIKVTVPEHTAAKYYVIAPDGATDINSRSLWNNAPKRAIALDPGSNSLLVGKGNMFAILAVACETAVNESFFYTVSSEIPAQPEPVPPDSIELDQESLLLETGAVAVLNATLSPPDAAELSGALVWESDNTGAVEIESVSGASAVILAKSPGTSAITVRTANGKSAACLVTVTEKPAPPPDGNGTIQLDKTSATLTVGNSIALHASILLENAENILLLWCSDAPHVAVVDDRGVVTAIKPGKALVFVQSRGGFMAECEITVSG